MRLGGNSRERNPTCCWVPDKGVSFGGNWAVGKWDEEPGAPVCATSSVILEPLASGCAASSATRGPVASSCATSVIRRFFVSRASLAFARVEESRFFIFGQLRWWFVYP